MNLRIPVDKCKLIDYPCPCCNGTDFINYNQDNPHNISLNLCKDCGFIFRSHFLDLRTNLEHLRLHHKSLPNISYYQKQRQKEYIIEKNFLPHKDMESKRILEVGCGIGTYLSINEQNSVGLEPSLSHCIYALHQENVDARPTFYIKDQNFDVIVIHDYIHFIPDVGNYLKELRSKLTDNGLIYIYSPVLEMPSLSFLKSCYNGMPCQYVNYFTQDTMKALLTNCGFDVFKIDPNVSDCVILAAKSKKMPKTLAKANPESSKKSFNDLQQILKLLSQSKFEEILNINKKILPAYIGQIKREHGVVVSVGDVFERILENVGEYAPAQGTVASAYHQKSMVREALSLLQKFEQKIMDAGTARIMALCWHDIGDFDKALYYFAIEEAMTGPNKEIFEMKASMHWQKRDVKEFL